MSRLLRPFLVMIAVSFFVSVSYAAAKKPADKGGGGGGAKATTEICKITGDVSSVNQSVGVGVDVGAYSPENIWLTLSTSLVTDSYDGEVPGVARVLKRQGRLDFYFDHSGNNTTCGARIDDSSTNVCPDRLILVDGIYDRKADTVSFSQPARVYLYVNSGQAVFGEGGRPMAPGESVTIDFEPYEN